MVRLLEQSIHPARSRHWQCRPNSRRFSSWASGTFRPLHSSAGCKSRPGFRPIQHLNSRTELVQRPVQRNLIQALCLSVAHTSTGVPRHPSKGRRNQYDLASAGQRQTSPRLSRPLWPWLATFHSWVRAAWASVAALPRHPLLKAISWRHKKNASKGTGHSQAESAPFRPSWQVASPCFSLHLQWRDRFVGPPGSLVLNKTAGAKPSKTFVMGALAPLEPGERERVWATGQWGGPLQVLMLWLKSIGKVIGSNSMNSRPAVRNSPNVSKLHWGLTSRAASGSQKEPQRLELHWDWTSGSIPSRTLGGVMAITRQICQCGGR